jgi:hypothetical protein
MENLVEIAKTLWQRNEELGLSINALQHDLAIEV